MIKEFKIHIKKNILTFALCLTYFIIILCFVKININEKNPNLNEIDKFIKFVPSIIFGLFFLLILFYGTIYEENLGEFCSIFIGFFHLICYIFVHLFFLSFTNTFNNTFIMFSGFSIGLLPASICQYSKELVIWVKKIKYGDKYVEKEYDGLYGFIIMVLFYLFIVFIPYLLSKKNHC